MERELRRQIMDSNRFLTVRDFKSATKLPLHFERSGFYQENSSINICV